MSIGEILYAIILYPIVQVIEVAYKIFSQLFSNTGIAIMGVSFVVTVLCLPLYIVAERWQQLERDTQAKLKPGIDRIKAVFTGDEQYMILATYYRQNRYHPMMALRSSFGLLIQVPFFMAAYSCLSSLPALQGQNFLFIRNMGEPDSLFTIGGFAVNVLPIAMTAINIAAGAIYTKGFALKEKAQIYGMAALFLALLYNSPAGLVLYWTMNNVFSLVKNIFYKLKHPVWVLYILMCAGIILVDWYVLFVYNGSASVAKRLAVVVPFSCLIGVPYLVKAMNWLLKCPLLNLVNTPPPIKLRVFIPVAVAWALLTGLVLPSSLVASSVAEFSDIGNYGNPAAFLWHSFFQSLGLFVFWPLCIFFLFKEKIQALLTLLFSMGFACGVVNAFAFVVNYGAMDIKFVFFNGLNHPSMGYVIVNLIVSMFCIAVSSILLIKCATRITLPVVIFSVAFIFLGIVNIREINREYSDFRQIKQNNIAQANDIKPTFSFSKTGKNVVVIMLDRAESYYLDYIFQDRPELLESFDGFINYKNTLAFHGATLMSSPALYGGYEYTVQSMNARMNIPLKDKHNEALLLMPRIFTEEGKFTSVQTDSSWGNYQNPSDMSFIQEYDKLKAEKLFIKYADFTKKQLDVPELEESLSNAIIRNLVWVSLFREVPAIIRPVVYYRGTYFNHENVVFSESFFDWFSGLYCLPYLTDFESSENSFMMITNEITHQEVENDFIALTNNEKLTLRDSMHYKENIITLETIGEWFELLRFNQVYDNTRIIIVSDHGIGRGIGESEFVSPILSSGMSKDALRGFLLYKDFNAHGVIQNDETFMTIADVPTLALEGIVENPINPFTGNPVDSELKEGGVYVTVDQALWSPEQSKSQYIFTVPDDSWYHVKDNIFVDSNWTQEVPR